jgi:hypothetical protein
MTVIDNIPFDLDRSRFEREVRAETYPELHEELARFVDQASACARPKAGFSVAFIDDRAGDRVVIGGEHFQSEILAENLAEINRVFPYVATCGTELDSLDLSGFDPFASFWHATIKAMALDAAYRELGRQMRETFGIERMSSMNPGSGNVDVWPIEQQRPLFALLGDAEGELGVRLTESFLMVPDKTVSGIFFASDVLYVNCQSCEREVCPDRRAPFRGR